MSIFAHIFSTEYSNEEAFGKLDKYNKKMIQAWAEHAKESGDPEPTLILADKFSVTAQVPFFEACMEYKVKPVFGLKAVVQGKDGGPDHEVILVAKNDTGRQNINRITTESYKITPTKGYKLITREDLENFKDGLICISGGANGLVEQLLIQDKYDNAKRVSQYFNKIFNGNFYLQARRTSNDLKGQEIENKIIESSKRLSNETGIKIVANNDVRFVKKEDYSYHLTRKDIINSNLSYDPSKKILETENQYLLPITHMLELFKDIPEAVYNMGDLVDSTDIMEFKSRLGKSHLPKFPIPSEFNDDSTAYLSHITNVGFEERWKKIDDTFRNSMGSNTKDGVLIDEDYIISQKQLYKDRIIFELDTINKTGFAGYFLIVHELVNWCKQNDIPVGPGRGSGAGSLVLFSLNITDVDPIPHDLLFERFLNPERMSEPDIDIDFSPRKRELVIQHMKDMYGDENTAQILTEGTMAARSVIDSIGRVKGMKPEERDKIKNLISDELGTTIVKELETNEKLQQLYKKSRQARRIIDEALKLEKSLVSYGKHAGGVVISLGDMAQYVALYREEGESSPVVQVNKDICEKLGLIKFDILGLKNLDIIQHSIKSINKGRPVNDQLLVEEIPLNDPLTISLFKNADTYGIFQFVSPGMRRLMKDLGPDNFEEIVALVALFRPGPLQSKMDRDFIERKYNASKIVYPHARLKETLGPTYGTIIYQEQVMSIAREMADYTLGQADILRKAMGKKDMEIMRKQRAMFLNGCMNSFRIETLQNTKEKMKAPYDPSKTIEVNLNFENSKSLAIKELLGATEYKFSTLDQVLSILKNYANVAEDELKIFELEVDGMDDKQYYGRFYSSLLKNGVPKLQADGLSLEDATDTMASVAVATSMFVRFNKIFSLMHKFAAYGFNKSHSVAYALVSFQTAYLKAHYPSQYMAAMLTNESNIDDVSTTLAEVRRMGLNIVSPDINLSDVEFKAATADGKEKNVIYGLEQIRGINKAVGHIVEIRNKKGTVKDIFDFYDKFGTYKIIDTSEKLDGTSKTSKKTLITKAVLNNLLNAGILDSICPNKDPKYRATLQATYHFIEEVVDNMNKKLSSNYKEITKRLKQHFNTKEIQTILLDSIGLDGDSLLSDASKYVELFFVPESLSDLDASELNKAYDKISEKIQKAVFNKPLVLKEINDYQLELDNYLPATKKVKGEQTAEVSSIEKIKIEHNGKTSIYIKPTSENYKDVPEYGTREAAYQEFHLTGMYQSINPINVGNIKDILKSKNINCSSSRELPQQVETFGKSGSNSDRKYYQTSFAGTVVEIKDFKRTNNDTGESYTDITVLVDDGQGVVTAKFKAEEMFLAGKEQRGIDMMKEMMKKEVIVFEGSASTGAYESAGVTLYVKKIGSTNPEFYLPLEDASLNFVEGEKEKMVIKSQNEEMLATTAQVGKLASLLKRNNVSYTEIYKDHNIDELSKLTKADASKLIQKYIDNKPSI